MKFNWVLLYVWVVLVVETNRTLFHMPLIPKFSLPVHYYPSNRRSTDSYDEEYYECYDRPRRRRQANWQHGGAQAAGGHSSSSRDVSPWEEEPRRRDVREPRPGYRHPRGPSFERHRERRHTDSWDEEDDYE